MTYAHPLPASSVGAREIAEEITGVNQSASEMSHSSGQVAMSAEELAVMAKKLNEMVGKFRV